MNLKHGDYVTCEIEGVKITDARISISGSDYYICQNLKRGSHAPNKLGYDSSWQFRNDEPEVAEVTNLKIVKRSITSHPLQEGDIIESNEDRRVVLGVLGKVVLISTDETGETASNGCYTAIELRRRGFKLVDNPEPTREPLLILTMDEIAEKFGKRADQIQIKKGE